MVIIGCDYHPGFQQIAFVNTDTREFAERRLEHREEAEKFYGDLGTQGAKVRVGMEASGHARWFERLLLEARFCTEAIRVQSIRRSRTFTHIHAI
jgi:transposase